MVLEHFQYNKMLIFGSDIIMCLMLHSLAAATVNEALLRV